MDDQQLEELRSPLLFLENREKKGKKKDKDKDLDLTLKILETHQSIAYLGVIKGWIARDKKKEVQKELDWKAVENIEVLLCMIWDVVCPAKPQFLVYLASRRHKKGVINQNPQLCRDCLITFYSVHNF